MPDSPPPDSADHAEDFAHRWADRLEQYCVFRMETLGLPDDKIGEPDDDGDGRWMAFNPYGRKGEGTVTGVVVDSGLLIPNCSRGKPGVKGGNPVSVQFLGRLLMDCGVAPSREVRVGAAESRRSGRVVRGSSDRRTDFRSETRVHMILDRLKSVLRLTAERTDHPATRHEPSYLRGIRPRSEAEDGRPPSARIRGIVPDDFPARR